MIKKVKWFFLIVCLLNAYKASSQVIEYFSETNFNQNSSWIGDLNKFYITTSEELRTTTNTLAESVYLSTISTLTQNASWEFWIKMNFDPSTNNQAKIYLISNSYDLKINLNGYYIQIGEAGSKDAIALYKQEGAISSLLVKGEAKTRTNNGIYEAFVKVTKDSNGFWQLFSKSDTLQPYILEGYATDLSIVEGGYTGVLFKYTVSNSNGFLFDNFLIKNWLPDYSVTPTTNTAKFKELIINEIMSDPSPAIDLPESEFVELWNVSSVTLSINGYKLSDGSATVTLPDKNISPNSFLILCPIGYESAFSVYGNTIGLSSWPSLNNTSDQLYLSNTKGEIIDRVAYQNSWHSSDKKEGGYSLELIYPSSNCSGTQNWASSKSTTGGTPGNVNSSYQKTAPEGKIDIERIEVVDSKTISILFNQILNSEKASQPITYKTNLEHYNVVSVTALSSKEFLLTFDQTLDTSRECILYVNNICNCFNDFTTISKEFTVPLASEPKDIIINEILFDPQPNGAEFVEIYNRCDKILNLKEIQIAGLDSKGIVSKKLNISDKYFLLYPKSYLVISTNKEDIVEKYPYSNASQIIEGDLPTLYNDGGTIFLFKNEVLIDSVRYSSNMHSKKLTKTQGVSLERISSDFGAIFTSASYTSGYATPGYRNSQSIDSVNVSNHHIIKVLSHTFSPDNDGFEDLLQIKITLQSSEWTGSIKIYDKFGNFVTELIKNKSLSSDELLTWDGLDYNLHQAPIGMYFLDAQFLDSTGQMVEKQIPIYLAKKFH